MPDITKVEELIKVYYELARPEIINAESLIGKYNQTSRNAIFDAWDDIAVGYHNDDENYYYLRRTIFTQAFPVTNKTPSSLGFRRF